MAAEKDETSGSGSESSEEEEMETSGTGTEIVNVEFEARSPEEADAASIQRLLKQLLPSGVDLTALTQLVLSQSYVGAVVIQPNDGKPAESEAWDDDEEDIFGLTTLINLQARKENPAVINFLDYLKSKYESKGRSVENKAKFSDLFEGKLGDVGWIINERFVNLPSQLAPNLFESLSADLEEAIAKSMPYKVSRYLLIAKAHVLKGGTIQNPLFVNDEEEMFFEVG
ncbi:hypothetical protein RvY_18855 [Ramazzottius varieornatus]|uniref:Protein BCCIP homolog n=1 Tax=Ramazzottius varieornatus TaxID=947166 RepID=A0A1D1W7I4_RAMVA|nr:hypothetical protein RvY_18855 [Ramazzottius varieornatus]